MEVEVRLGRILLQIVRDSTKFGFEIRMFFEKVS
jgi:hypothetical protein